jgi:hypothetical protein
MTTLATRNSGKLDWRSLLVATLEVATSRVTLVNRSKQIVALHEP